MAAASAIIAVIIYFLIFFETTLFSLHAETIQNLSKSEKGSLLWLGKEMKEPKNLEIFFITSRGLLLSVFFVLVDILVGTFSLTATVHAVVDIAILWLFFILFFQLIPMSSAMRKAELSPFTASCGRMLFYVFLPFTLLWKFILKPLTKNGGPKSLESLAFERELASIISSDDSIEELEAVEKQMIKHIVDFSDTSVREIMSPRVDMICVKDDTPPKEVINIIEEIGHSRMPIYHERIDDIVGILYAKDLLIAMGTNVDFSLKSIAREPYFVPEAKPVNDLLTEFRIRKNHMAIVVDEYGGVSGLVTMEDILEEIVGEIQDEYDEEEAPIVQLSDNAFLVTAKTTIDEVNEFTGLNLPEGDDFDSIGGMIFNQLGEVPEDKKKIELPEHKIVLIVEEVSGHRIGKVKIILTDGSEEDEK